MRDFDEPAKRWSGLDHCLCRLREYRVVLLDDEDRTVARVSIQCETDEEACNQARRGLEPSKRIEVWDSERLVVRGDALARHIWR